jgi:hypothetical protein
LTVQGQPQILLTSAFVDDLMLGLTKDRVILAGSFENGAFAPTGQLTELATLDKVEIGGSFRTDKDGFILTLDPATLEVVAAPIQVREENNHSPQDLTALYVLDNEVYLGGHEQRADGPWLLMGKLAQDNTFSPRRYRHQDNSECRPQGIVQDGQRLALVLQGCHGLINPQSMMPIKDPDDNATTTFARIISVSLDPNPVNWLLWNTPEDVTFLRAEKTGETPAEVYTSVGVDNNVYVGGRFNGKLLSKRYESHPLEGNGGFLVHRDLKNDTDPWALPVSEKTQSLATIRFIHPEPDNHFIIAGDYVESLNLDEQQHIGVPGSQSHQDAYVFYFQLPELK